MLIGTSILQFIPRSCYSKTRYTWRTPLEQSSSDDPIRIGFFVACLKSNVMILLSSNVHMYKNATVDWVCSCMYILIICFSSCLCCERFYLSLVECT